MFRSHYEHTALIATVAGCLAVAGIAYAQSQPTTPAQSPPPSSSTPTQMAAMTPSKSETFSSAFQKLDATQAGYVTKEQAAKLDGFDKAFTQADTNNDGKLDRDEFKAAWETYTGKPQG
jgi:Ca2+-binding EF-hand superfamily protein